MIGLSEKKKYFYPLPGQITFMIAQEFQGIDLLKITKRFIFTLFVVTLFGSVKSELSNQQQRVYGNYVFSYEAGDSLLLQRLISRVEPGLKELSVFFGEHSGGVITIYLTKSDRSYKDQAWHKIPEWSQAVAFTRERFIVMRLANAQEIKTAPQTLLHELVHMHIAQRMPTDRMPLWLNEGLAQYLSFKALTLDDKVLLANKLALKQILELSALDSMQNFSATKARLAYVQALSAVYYFEKKYKYNTLSLLVVNLARYHSINDAFRATIGIDFIDFERQWYEYLKKNYRWLVVLNIDNLLWVIMGLLAILAIYTVRRQNQKKISDWSDLEDNQLIEGNILPGQDEESNIE